MPAEQAAKAEGIVYPRGDTCQRRSRVFVSVVMAVLEREEIDRWLDGAKTELFAEQRRSREKLESMQDVRILYLCLKL